MSGIITIDDIAKMAGVGKGTVDRVLHNRGRVSEETRKRVMQCIEELDYKPNIAARMLARKRTYRIGICYHTFENEFWAQLRDGIDRAAMEHEPLGVELVPLLLEKVDVEGQLEMIRRAEQDGLDGLALVPYYSDRIVESLNRLIASGTAVVAFNNFEKGLRAGYIGANGIQSGRTAGRMMSVIARPNSRCCVVSAHSSLMMQVDERAMGFREVICRERPDITITGSHVFEENYDAVYRFILNNAADVDAIYATNECVSAVGRALSELPDGKRITVVGHDLTPTIVQYIRDGYVDVSIGQDPERQGYGAIDKICRKLLRGEEITDEYTRISIVVAENLDYI